MTAALTLALLAAACNRTSDAPGADTAGAGGAAAAGDAAWPAGAPKLMAQREEAMARRVRPAAPPVEAGVASAVAADSRAISLGSPISGDLSGAMLIRNGQASVEVKRVDDAVARLRQTAGQLGGFVANTAIVGGREEHRTATLELRVPSSQFDAAVAALSALGKVESVSATVQDVGEEYVDLAARAANARHMEARLVEMLARRTGKLSEALTVEQELRRVREEIERYDARLKWLERRTALSSLEVTLREPMSVLDQRGPNPIAEAFAEAWRRAVGVLAWAIASLGILVPLGLLFAGMLLLARRLLRPGGPAGVAGA
ncbi:MAG TPA: DUF4349 domain-containing protein [Gemmatimonadaceae bacterium]|nr:DUF4349 domain-containing protein [Gemmatimonadaceae bacterium]